MIESLLNHKLKKIQIQRPHLLNNIQITNKNRFLILILIMINLVLMYLDLMLLQYLKQAFEMLILLLLNVINNLFSWMNINDSCFWLNIKIICINLFCIRCFMSIKNSLLNNLYFVVVILVDHDFDNCFIRS